MTADDFSEPDLHLLALLRGAGDADRLVDEIIQGFSAERAALMLESTEHFARLAELVVSIAPGRGWYHTAATPDETGLLNRRLLLRVELLRTDPTHTHGVDRGDRHTRLVSRRVRVDAVSSATVALPGGWATWDCADLSETAVVGFEGAVPEWLAGLVGASAAGAVVSGAAAIDTEEGQSGGLLARYALANWIFERHPGTGDPEHPFHEALHRIELGTLAWEAQSLLGTKQRAAEWLTGTGKQIVALNRRIQSWTGWRRSLAERVVQAACDAYLETWPAAADVAGVRQLRDALARADAQVEMLDYAELSEPDVALVAGHATGGDILRRDEFTVDPLLVPARSIHASAPNARWDIIEGDELELMISAAPGDSPVASVAATVIVDGHAQVIGLSRGELGYRGSLILTAEPESVEVHVHAVGVSGPFRDSEAVEETRRQIQAVLTTRRDVFDSLIGDDGSLRFQPAGPFLAELVSWRTELGT